jgi:hypothetical protein
MRQQLPLLFPDHLEISERSSRFGAPSGHEAFFLAKGRSVVRAEAFLKIRHLVAGGLYSLRGLHPRCLLMRRCYEADEGPPKSYRTLLRPDFAIEGDYQ